MNQRTLGLLHIGAAVALLALMLTGCYGPQTPEERGVEVNRDIIAIYNQEKAMLTLEYMVEDEFNVSLNNVFESAVVWWADTSCAGRDEYGIQWGRQCMHGMMWYCEEMYVALSNKDPNSTCGSALLHEFGHCLSGHVFNGDNDGDHDGLIWPVVQAAEKVSCGRGW